MKFYRCLENSLAKYFGIQNSVHGSSTESEHGIAKIKFRQKRFHLLGPTHWHAHAHRHTDCVSSGSRRCHCHCFDKWSFDETKGWKLIQFNPKINTKVIFKRLIDLWCHKKFTNEKIRNVSSLSVVRFSTYPKQSWEFGIIFGKHRLKLFCFFSVRIFTPISIVADVNASIPYWLWYRFCWINFVDNSDIEWHWRWCVYKVLVRS